MDAGLYIQNPESLLDIGCNTGAWLQDCRKRFPRARLAGMDVNATALAQAQLRAPSIQFAAASATNLPFLDESFQYITMLEVIEHLPESQRRAVLEEIRRVLTVGGRLILSAPHRGLFAWADSNNVRFSLPRIYQRFVGSGMRKGKVEWHQHFKVEELIALAGGGWKVFKVVRGGLFLYPLADWLSWPFYRAGKGAHPARLFLQRLANADIRRDYGRASYGLMLVLEKL
jgi:SAM-dependent methyltransferase